VLTLLVFIIAYLFDAYLMSGHWVGMVIWECSDISDFRRNSAEELWTALTLLYTSHAAMEVEGNGEQQARWPVRQCDSGCTLRCCAGSYARGITWQRLRYIRSRSLYFVSLCVCSEPQQTVSRKFQLGAIRPWRDAGHIISGPAFFLLAPRKTLRFG